MNVSTGKRVAASAAWLAGLLVLGLFYFPVFEGAFKPASGSTLKGALVLLMAFAGHLLVLIGARRVMPVWVGLVMGLFCGGWLLMLTFGLVITLPIIAVELNSNSASLKATLVPAVLYAGALAIGALGSMVSAPLPKPAGAVKTAR